MNDNVIARKQQSILSTNKVLRNTYMLLSMTLLFSAACAIFAVASNAPSLGWLTLLGMLGLLFLTQALRNSVWGLVSIFAFTGFMGYTLGPLLNMILTFSNGGAIIATAFASTGIIFLALSGYAIVTKKDFSYLGGFIFAAIIGAFILMIIGIFTQAPALFLIINAVFILISSGLILFETSMIIRGGETNYIMATITLYVSLYNLFVSLLQIFAAFSGNRD